MWQTVRTGLPPKSGNPSSVKYYQLFTFMANGGFCITTFAKFGSYHESVHIAGRIASVRSSFSEIPVPAFVLHFCTFWHGGLRYAEQIPSYIFSGLWLFQPHISKNTYTGFCVSLHMGTGFVAPQDRLTRLTVPNNSKYLSYRCHLDFLLSLETIQNSSVFLMYSQLPTVLDRNSPGADLKAWGKVLSNVSQAVQKVGGLIIDGITFLGSA